MIKITLNNKWYEWEYDGIKLIECNNCHWTVKKLIQSISNNELIQIDNKNINKSNIIFINEYTKITDLINLNKSNLFFKEINGLFDFSKLIDEKIGLEIKDNINNLINEKDFVDFEVDINSIISIFFSANKTLYLNDKNFIEILNIYKKSIEKYTIILSNIDFIKIDLLKNYVDWFNFIIFTNDLRNEISNFDCMNEIICVENYDGIFNEILDIEKMLLYIEEKINIETSLKYANSCISLKRDNIFFENWRKIVKNL